MSFEDKLQASEALQNLAFNSSDELGKLSAALAARARRQLDLVSRALEPSAYDTSEFLDAVKNLVVTRRGRVRMVLLDPAALISRGGCRLVDLAMRLSSFMEIRKPGPDHREFNEGMLIADRRGVIHRKFSDRYEGMADFDSPAKAAVFAERFEELWQYGEAIPYFRRLML